MASESMSLFQIIIKFLFCLMVTGLGIIFAGAAILLVILLYSYEGFEGIKIFLNGSAW